MLWHPVGHLYLVILLPVYTYIVNRNYVSVDYNSHKVQFSEEDKIDQYQIDLGGMVLRQLFILVQMVHSTTIANVICNSSRKSRSSIVFADYTTNKKQLIVTCICSKNT